MANRTCSRGCAAEVMKDLVREFRRLRQLQPSQRRDVLVAAALLTLFWLALRVPGLPLLRRRADTSATGRPASPADSRRAKDLAHIVNATAMRAFGPGQCLTRSLSLQWMLRRRGIASQLRIGVRRTGANLSAHAWVECAGEPVNDDVSVGAHYAVFNEPLRLADFEA